MPERPAAALVEVADARDARFIVVGTWGESPLRGAILGSTPHKLLHLSHRPVVVVPGLLDSPVPEPMLKEFREFILRGNLVDLAVAVVIGTAFAAVVTRPSWPTWSRR